MTVVGGDAGVERLKMRTLKRREREQKEQLDEWRETER